MRISDKYKAIVAAIGTTATAFSAALSDNVLGMDEVGSLVTTVLTAGATVYGVWRAPNRE